MLEKIKLIKLPTTFVAVSLIVGVAVISVTALHRGGTVHFNLRLNGVEVEVEGTPPSND
jgi:hypothetical protein